MSRERSESRPEAAPRVRAMRESDVPGVLAVERTGYAFPWSARVFLDCLRSRHAGWVLELDGVIAGHLIVSVAAGEAHVLNLCVHPRCQGQGLGRRLMLTGLEHAAQSGADSMFLEVRPSNPTARALYDSLGFSEIGHRPEYYPAEGGRREMALVMARALIPFESGGER